MANFTQDPPIWSSTFLHLPYHKYDCWKLCGYICEAGPPLIGLPSIKLPDFSEDLEHTADESLWTLRLRGVVNRLVEQEKVIWNRITGDPESFDIGLYLTHGRWHVATVVGGGWAINTDLKKGSHPLRLRDSRWSTLLEGYYRHASLI